MPEPGSAHPRPTRFGRYTLLGEIASGGAATVFLATLDGPEGFRRAVAVKRPHRHLARAPEFAEMFLEEARLAARVRHANVVPTLDVVDDRGELGIVMEYVEGESLAMLNHLAARSGRPPSIGAAARVVADALEGLHAAHEARDERGRPLGIVHRDVSPQNVLVGADGLSRVVDFGIAKAAGRANQTSGGRVKGKLAYVAPEYLSGEPVDRRSDLYSAAVVLWELVAGQYLFAGENEYETLSSILLQPVRPLLDARPDAPPRLAAIVERALARDPAERFADARAMARELERAVELASNEEVGAWVRVLAGETLAANAATLARAEAAAAAFARAEAAAAALARGPESTPRAPLAATAAAEPAAPPAPSLVAEPVARPAAASVAEPAARELTLHGVASTPPPAPLMPRWPWLAAGLVVSLALGGGLARVLPKPAADGAAASASARAASSADALAVGATTAAPVTNVAPAVASAAGAAARPAVSGGAGGAGGAAGKAVGAGPGAALASTAKGPRRPAPGAPKARPAPPSCDPPFAYDKAGIRRIKPQCP